MVGSRRTLWDSGRARQGKWEKVRVGQRVDAARREGLVWGSKSARALPITPQTGMQPRPASRTASSSRLPPMPALRRIARSSAISLAPESSHLKPPRARELSPAAQACSSWFRKLARALKVCRLYKTDNTVVLQAREQVLNALVKLLEENGGWALRFTPTEIWLNDEPVVTPSGRPTAERHETAVGGVDPGGLAAAASRSAG